MDTLREERIGVVKNVMHNNPLTSIDQMSGLIVDALSKNEANRHAHLSRTKITWADETEPENDLQGSIW